MRRTDLDDTSPEAYRLLVARLRELTPEDRLREILTTPTSTAGPHISASTNCYLRPEAKRDLDASRLEVLSSLANEARAEHDAGRTQLALEQLCEALVGD